MCVCFYIIGGCLLFCDDGSIITPESNSHFSPLSTSIQNHNTTDVRRRHALPRAAAHPGARTHHPVEPRHAPPVRLPAAQAVGGLPIGLTVRIGSALWVFMCLSSYTVFRPFSLTRQRYSPQTATWSSTRRTCTRASSARTSPSSSAGSCGSACATPGRRRTRGRCRRGKWGISEWMVVLAG